MGQADVGGAGTLPLPSTQNLQVSRLQALSILYTLKFFFAWKFFCFLLLYVGVETGNEVAIYPNRRRGQLPQACQWTSHSYRFQSPHQLCDWSVKEMGVTCHIIGQPIDPIHAPFWRSRWQLDW